MIVISLCDITKMVILLKSGYTEKSLSRWAFYVNVYACQGW